MSNIKYSEYLQSEHWAAIRIEIINYYGGKCNRCGHRPKRRKNLNVHHLTYERLGKEEPEDLELLCAKCHMAEHGLIKPKPKFKPKKKKKKLDKGQRKTLRMKQEEKRLIKYERKIGLKK